MKTLYRAAGNIKFSTLGYGLTCVMNARLKLTIYCEAVVNNNTQLQDYNFDLKDNVLTAQCNIYGNKNYMKIAKLLGYRT